jgi:hypothetical protein
MTALTAWLPYVQLPSCPQMIAIDAIRQAARDFCERTFAWTHMQDAMTVYANEPEYELEPPDNAEAVRVLEAWLSGAPIRVRSVDELNRIYRTNSWNTATGSPRHLVNLSRHTARLVPIPEERVVAGLVLRIAVKPTTDATEICDEIFDEFRDAIAAGARAILQLMPAQPFSSPKQGAIDRAMFESAVADELIQFWRGYGVNGQTAYNPHGKFA